MDGKTEQGRGEWILARLRESGFDPILVMPGTEAGEAAGRVILAFMTYLPEKRDEERDVWIHPYYPVSQRAYRAVESLCREGSEMGIRVQQAPEVRLKPIFARIESEEIAWIVRGRNTLSYLPGVGSRFHVQTLLTDEDVPVNTYLAAEGRGPECGSCRACLEACPTGAILDGGFQKERCIRFWQLSGKLAPEEIRKANRNRLIGCDVCQWCCPKNRRPERAAEDAQRQREIALRDILENPKGMSEQLGPAIGRNLALPNRLLTQALVMAGAERRQGLKEQVEALTVHPSPSVREAAAWALGQFDEG
ncbi:MAG: hypothetical protein IJ083_08850 [Clostridia bacterium]|nr:hypothetical protein [Clostridia bacterium]